MRERLRRKILTLPVGSPISSERDLAVEYGVSRMTARRAVADLASEGFLERHVGRGTFVAQPRIELRLALSSFSEDMRAKGMRPGAQVLDFGTASAGHEDPFPTGSTLVSMTRLRTGDDIALAIEETRLDAALVPGLTAQDVTGSLYELLNQRFGVRLVAGEQRIIAVGSPADVAAALKLKPGSPIIRMDRQAHTTDRLAEHTVSWYRADAYEFMARLLPA